MQKIVNFIKNNKFFLLGFLVLAWVIFINLFPKGYVFGGGDTDQFINLKENYFQKIFYGWSGSAAFFYFLFYVLDKIGLSYSTQLSFHLGFIIFGAYISFYIFSRLIFAETSDVSRTLVSLFYSLNLYTLFLFTGNWGYSYFPSLYVFIPILTGLFIKFLKTEKFIYGGLFVLTLFLTSSGFGNPAFALSFTLFIFFLALFLVIFGYIKLSKKLALKITAVSILSLLVSLFWILPITPQTTSGIEGLSTSNLLDFDLVLRTTSSPIFNTLSLLNFTGDHFPLNFYYKILSFLKNIFILFSFIPIFFVFRGLAKFKKLKNKNLFAVFLSALIIFTMLAARSTAPFEITNYYIFHIWGFNVLRGFDKTAIYIPFLLSALVLITIGELNLKKWVYAIFFVTLLAPLPFFIGKIQQTAGQRVSSEKDYKKAGMSFLIKIPDKYYAIQKTINTNKENSQIGILPATRNDGSGIISYPEWKLYGVDITYWLYNKNFIYQNVNYFSNWNFPQEFGSSDNNFDWLIKTLGMMNSRYIIYHKDAPDDSVKVTEYKMRILEKDGLIKNLEENDYFILYKIYDDYFIPYITWQKENIEIQPNIRSIESNFSKIKNSVTLADFKEINPKKFEVAVKNIGNNIILAEKYDPLWKAYYITAAGKELEIKDHFLARGYANGWQIDENIPAKKIIIEYYPTRLMWRGIWISGITVLLLLIYLIKYYLTNIYYAKKIGQKNI